MQQDTLGHSGRKHDPLYRIRRLLLTGQNASPTAGGGSVRVGRDAGDPHEDVWYAWTVKEALRRVYRAEDEPDARDALAEFYDVAAAAGMPETTRLAGTIRRRHDQVLAYYRCDGLSNARASDVHPSDPKAPMRRSKTAFADAGKG